MLLVNMYEKYIFWLIYQIIAVNNSCHQLMIQIPYLAFPLTLSNSHIHTFNSHSPYTSFKVELLQGTRLWFLREKVKTFHTVCNSATLLDKTNGKAVSRVCLQGVHLGKCHRHEAFFFLHIHLITGCCRLSLSHETPQRGGFERRLNSFLMKVMTENQWYFEPKADVNMWNL